MIRLVPSEWPVKQMSETETEVVGLSTVPLTRQKQDIIDAELEKYARATNYIIAAIFGEPPSNKKKILQGLRNEFYERFDDRPDYFEDVLVTARLEIRRHKAQAKYLRNLRDKVPSFEEGELRFSAPIVEVGEKAIVLKTSDDEVPLPFDKYSRNKNAQVLEQIRSGGKAFERVRFKWNKEGYFDVDIRMEE